MLDRITDTFQGHLFDIKHNANTTVARHFASHHMISRPEFTIHIMEYIKMPKFVSMLSTVRNRREMVWMHRVDTLIPNDLNMLNLGVQFGET